MDCKHERVEEAEGVVFCTTCGMETDRFYGFSYKGPEKKVKKYYCDKCDKSFLKDCGLQRHLKSHF